ncbi:splicing factor, proline- and glutamine-rich-like isoform X1 [Frankliniella occidentalis]|uniref:Splicing factor, proline- and glutamine-rich-like isoform X1 n=2 Tax=Frankliniella occidentalis TaxID=133901 RepID=A0A9C6U1E2_FRAOC|nr:splicing factor, proline- and glutamine-rich-like isoform X1 [Frankliniella occidentalis]XP_052125745.1 splicing factor, proline- and glutamine-rich-like isoform X1 [Frankliniella occidentalis]XP_052125746.1 splicing factor, proline- and glutamine-rich-like isoform X1 [Frankliniella occidentalis]XP_052125747.1 splicing factor, proline- and glutamine-rich-like isoform X1 [Frankliniella occidentalis]XP_052125748.1 splicing factor, proline- and glutamine-rich-like isoform X1 [Frankliniella occi
MYGARSHLRLPCSFSPATLASIQAGPASGVTWWAMMSGAPYEDSPPPHSLPVTSPGPVATAAVVAPPHTPSLNASSSAASSASPPTSAVPSSVPPAPSSAPSAPIHIPAKRPSTGGGYSDCGGGGGGVGGGDSSGSVIRHGHAQPWSYPGADMEQPHYGTPTYYNLPEQGRDSRKPVPFWSPAAASAAPTPTPEYKYSVTAGGGAEQPGFPQPWCNYPTYAAPRHHSEAAHYLGDERRGMEATAFSSHDSYALRNYQDPVPATTYPPPGQSTGVCLRLACLYVAVGFFLGYFTYLSTIIKVFSCCQKL